MAEKRRKKPRHTNLVVPGDKKRDRAAKKADRMGRRLDGAPQAAPPAEAPPLVPHAPGAETAGTAPAEAPAPVSVPPPAPPQQPEKTSFWQNFRENLTGRKAAPKPAKAAPEQAAPKAAAGPVEAGRPTGQDDPLPPGAVRLPKAKKKKRRASPARRRRRRRRIGFLVLVLLVLAGILFYTSGLYLTVGTLLADTWDSLTIAARPGDGFPMELAVTRYVKAEAMGTNGFAVLGERDAAIISSTGAELRRVHHNYLVPGLSAGKTRVVVYSRGGREYMVEGRSRTMATGTTEQDIVLCALSPDGWLAVVTNSRFRAKLEVYGPDYNTDDWKIQVPIIDEEPLLVEFASDNRNFVLGCVSTRGGALASTLYLMRTDRAEVQYEIKEDDAMLLRAEYLSGNRLLAVYDKAAVLYSRAGEEIARYGFGNRRLLSADYAGGNLALLFGTTSEDTLHAVLLDGGLEALFDIAVAGGAAPRILADGEGAYLLVGQQVTAFLADGTPAASQSYEARVLGMVHGGQPLLITASRAEPLASLMVPPEASGSAAQPTPATSGSGPPPEDPSAKSGPESGLESSSARDIGSGPEGADAPP